MLNILKSKIIIYFAIFGAAFSFLLAVFSGVSVFWLVIRIFAGGILMGSLGFGLDFFLRQSLSEDDYKTLFNKAPRAEGPAPENPKNIDITDDLNLSPENEYKNMYSQESGQKKDELQNLTGVPEENMYAQPTSPTADESDFVSGPSIPQAPQGMSSGNEFKEEDLTAAPRVSEKTFEPREGVDDGLSPAQNELARNESLGYQSGNKFSNTPSVGDGTVKFNVGKKKITADPKVIAKAIRTVLQRDK